MKLRLTHWPIIVILLIICIELVVLSCQEGKEHDFETEQIKIEGCEYFKFGTSYGYDVITHKGNCANPIHTCP